MPKSIGNVSPGSLEPSAICRWEDDGGFTPRSRSRVVRLTQWHSHRGLASPGLVDLLSECHRRVRDFLTLAGTAATSRDAPVDQVMRACADVERYFVEAFPLHVADEEQSIGPRLRGISPEVDQALDDMSDQHLQHAPQVTALLRASARVRRDPSDPTAREQLAAVVSGLQRRLGEHLRLEERVLFPAVRDLLSDETRASIIEELRQRRRDGRQGWGAKVAQMT